MRLAQRSNVVEDPERAPVRGDHQIIAVNRHILHRRYRQIQLQRPPIVSVIVRDVNAELGPGKEHPFLLRIFTHRSHKRRSVNALGDHLPRLAVVPRSINVRSLIVEPVRVHRRIRFARIEVGSFDQRDSAPIRDSLWGHIFPALPAIACQVNQTGIAARPDHSAVQAGGRNRKHHAIAELLGIINCGSRSARLGVESRGRSREIGADRAPVQAAIRRLQHVLRPQKQRRFVEGREDQHGYPGIAILAGRNLRAKNLRRPGRDVLA